MQAALAHSKGAMQFSDDCRSHALVLMEIANVSPKFKEQALALAETWLTLANIHNRFCPNPSFSGPVCIENFIRIDC